MKTLVTLLLFALTCIVTAQTTTITGTVTDESGLPLPGANVIIKDTSNGTQTDFDGKYAIEASIGQTLTFAYIGYETEEIKIQDSKPIHVQLEISRVALDEVVITGYVNTKKEVLTSAISIVSADQISTTRSVDRILQGKTAGVSVTTANGKPGATAFVRIRGSSSLVGNTSIHNLPTVENESYARISENIFKNVATAPLSTFSVDVDKAGYSNIRRMINNGETIPQDAVKIEEMINYFAYDYPQPKGDDPFSIQTEIAQSPWNKDAKLIRIGLRGKDIATKNLPNSNLVFLLDVSGSMNSPNKLPLLKSALGVLVDNLREQDKVSIVVYAGAAGVVLKPTSGIDRMKIMGAIENLGAGGSTAGGEGIKLAYKIAEENFIKGGNNRIILATDGDFNVGASSDRAMEDLIEEKRKSGVFLTCLGFGMGNYKDSKMETLADKGNGNHAYIDTMQEAKKVLGTEFFGTLYTIAKDVKLQVEFNPAKVQAYRLIGYENRLLNDEDFKDDTKDAGEIGSGHTVTALYEVIPTGVKSIFVKDVSELKYTKTTKSSEASSEDILTVKFRYKAPDGDTSKLMVKSVTDTNKKMSTASADFQFSAAVALFGMQLRKSIFTNTMKAEDVIKLAEAGKGADKDGYRSEFIRLVKSYKINP